MESPELSLQTIRETTLRSIHLLKQASYVVDSPSDSLGANTDTDCTHSRRGEELPLLIEERSKDKICDVKLKLLEDTTEVKANK